MSIFGPALVSCSALPTEVVIVRAGSDAYLIVGKTHQGVGFPRVELEIFTVSSIIAAQTGPRFFNVNPLQVSILQDNFYQMSAITTSGSIIRFYYNTSTVNGGQQTIYRREIDAITRFPVGSRIAQNFEGIDPFILDGRTLTTPNHLYLLYTNSNGHLLARESFNLGTLWRNEIVLIEEPPSIQLCEANILDPLGNKEQLQLLLKRAN
jgi:hypothetical protein